MRKRTLLSTLFAVAAILGVLAAPVTPQQALQEAQSFVRQHQSASVPMKLASRAQRVQAAADMGYYYVFNIGADGGFVIVSGDDRTNPILGYSFEGTFNPDRVPANMQNWLDGYAEQMKVLDRMGDAQASQALAIPRRAVVVTRNSISPMITTKWDQAAPYWNECPEFMSIDENGDTIGDLAFAGCVATAMSQIMKFHNWPEQTTKAIPSYSFSIPNGDYTYSSVQMEELPVTTFDWAHMLDSYTGGEDQVYADAVAHLIYYAGAAVKTQYGLSGSGAYTDDIPRGFTEYFAYDSNTIQIKFRTDFTLNDWNELVYQELAAGRPMIYNGTAGSGGGHSFVCDGYEYGDYYHINWGWSGMGNGYFQLAVLNPHESGIGGSTSAEGYNMKQNVVIGIQPGEAGSDPGVNPVVDALTATGIATGFSGSLERDSQSQGFSIYKRKTFKINFADHVGTQKKYDVGLALYDTNMNFVQMVINRGVYATALTSALGSYENLGSNIEARDAVKFAAGLTGNYRMVPVYQLQGTTEWNPMLESDRYYLDVVITATTASFTAHPMLDLVATQWECEGGEKVGSPEQIHVTLHNNSVDRFFGNLYLWFGNQQLDEFSQYTTSIQAEVLAGQDAVVTFNVTPQNAGTQTLRITYDESGYQNVSGTGTVTVQQTQEQEMAMSVAIEAVNALDGVIYDNHVRFRADITNNGLGEYNKYVLAPLFLVHKDDNGNVTGGEMVTYKQSTLSLQPGETKSLFFDFENLGFDQTYSLNIYARNENDQLVNLVETGHSVYYDIRRGLVVWTSDDMGQGSPASGDIVIPDNAIAARLEGLDITSVRPNTNPNTLYLIGADEAVPAGLEQSNVVRGAQAGNIILKDGYPWFTPQSFTAAQVTYERVMQQSRRPGENTAWSTVVLPFAPTTITADGVDVALCGSDTDSEGQLWVDRFAYEDDGVPAFECVSAIEANVPYLIAAAPAIKGKVLRCQAGNVLIKADPIAYTSGENYLMAGTYLPLYEQAVYVGEEYDAAATLMRSSHVAPFRAYFKRIGGEVDDHGQILFPGQPVASELGDVNLDGFVDIADVNALINVILETVPADEYAGVKDINNDQEIDIEDVNMLINIILNN